MKHFTADNLQHSLRRTFIGAVALVIVQTLVSIAPAPHFAATRVVAVAAGTVAPANDDCAAATVVTDLPFSDTVDTSGATTPDSDPLQSCTDGGPSRNSKSVWYRFTARHAGDFIATTGGSDFDTVLTRYGGDCAALTEAQCNDDRGAFFQSRLTFHATAGETLRFEVTAFNDDNGGTLVFRLRPLAPPPLNDDCSAPTMIDDLPFEDTLDTTRATSAGTDPAQTCSEGGSRNAHSVWYVLTAPSTGAFIARTRGSDYDTVLSAHSGPCAALAAVACSDDIGGPQSGIRFAAERGQRVLIEVTDFDGATGGGTLVLEVFPAGQAPSTPGSLADPEGDTFGAGDTQPDLSSYAACSTSTDLQLTATFSTPISPGDSGTSDAVAGYIDLDTDLNPATGVLPFTDFFSSISTPVASSGMGTDFFVDLFTFDSTSGRADVLSEDGTVTGQASVSFAATSVTVVIPLAVIGAENGVVNTAALIGTLDEPTDTAPNAGSLVTIACTSTGACIGDCNNDQQVTVDEILLGVNIALENVSVERCRVFDANNDGGITVDEILRAVNRALNGC